MNKYYTIFEILDFISEPNKSIFLKIINENKDIFFSAKGSNTKHQAWEGGYIDHITECCNIAISLYNSLNNLRKLPFSIEDCCIVIFLHDIEKPWLYNGKISIKKRDYRYVFRESLFTKYKISLTEDHFTAIRYIEGEGKDYSSTKRILNPLGAFCHSCDVISARIWYDKPEVDQKNSW